MPRNTQTSAVIDSLLRLRAAGVILSVGILAPNAIQALDKPLNAYFNKLDKRAREREFNKLMQYMRRQGLVSNKPDDYEHGLVITKSGLKRLQKNSLYPDNIAVPKTWDQKWRLVLFDIPEKHRKARSNFTYQLRRLGLQQLQASVWIHPFPCREEISKLALSLSVDKYTTYIETDHIDNVALLKERFYKTFKSLPAHHLSHFNLKT